MTDRISIIVESYPIADLAVSTDTPEERVYAIVRMAVVEAIVKGRLADLTDTVLAERIRCVR